MNRRTSALIVACVGLATPVFGQTVFFNGNMELPPQLLVDPQPPAGWHVPGNDPQVRYRTNGDGFNNYTAHSGNGFLEIDASGSGGFRGITTDIRNYVHNPATGVLCVDGGGGQAAGVCPGPWPFYDAPFNWDGGDLHVSMWYNIPDTLFTPLNPSGEIVLLKVEIKGAGNGNQDNATYEYSISSVDAPTTNGQWVQLTATIAIAQIRAEVTCNATPGCASPGGYFSIPPYPDRAKITVGRFTGDGNANVGTVLIDDIVYTQDGAGPQPCNIADITGIGGPPSTPDGLLTGDDFNAFISAFAVGDSLADVCGIGGPPAAPDGLITGDDFNAFIAAFANGCP